MYAMLLDVIGLILVVEFLTICLSGLCNAPLLAIGIKHFCRRCFAKHYFADVKASLEKKRSWNAKFPLFVGKNLKLIRVVIK